MSSDYLVPDGGRLLSGVHGSSGGPQLEIHLTVLLALVVNDTESLLRVVLARLFYKFGRLLFRNFHGQVLGRSLIGAAFFAPEQELDFLGDGAPVAACVAVLRQGPRLGLLTGLQVVHRRVGASGAPHEVEHAVRGCAFLDHFNLFSRQICSAHIRTILTRTSHIVMLDTGCTAMTGRYPGRWARSFLCQHLL